MKTEQLDAYRTQGYARKSFTGIVTALFEQIEKLCDDDLRAIFVDLSTDGSCVPRESAYWVSNRDSWVQGLSPKLALTFQPTSTTRLDSRGTDEGMNSR